VFSVYAALSRAETLSHGDFLARNAKKNRKEFDMNQQYAEKRRVFVLLTLVWAILMGLVWLASVHSARAQGTFLLETSYKDATPRKVGAGGTVAYSIVLNNDTLSTTTAIEANDPLATELSYVGFSARVMPEGAGFGLPSGSGVKFTVNPIAAGGTVTLSFQATVTTTVSPDDVITNTATITEGGVAFTRSVAITITDAPIVQIRQPVSGTLLTANSGTSVVISGYAWDSSNDPGFPATPVIDSIGSPSGGAYFVNWTQGADALVYHLQESTSPYFDQNLVDYNPTTALYYQYVTGKTSGTYYYRLRAMNLEGSSRWSDVRSVVVAPALLWQLAEGFESPTTGTATAAVPSVFVRINGGVWQAATVTENADGYWDWDYDWSLPQEDDAVYIIEARSQDAGGNYGEIDTIRVTIRNGIRYVYLPLIMRRYPPIPYAPTLNLDNNDGYGNYTLSWIYVPDTDPYKPTSYTFQEATDANFTNLLFNASATSPRSYTNKAVGTYYYRVRGNNAYGAGSWSNVQTVVVKPKGFYDTFSDVNSGWPRQVFNVDGRGVLDAAYDNGTYRMKILLDTYGLNNRRMGILPAPYTHTDNTYDVEVQHRFVKAADQSGFDPTAGKAGIVFYGVRTDGGTGYFETPYIVEWNFEGQCSISRYLNYSYATGHNPYVPVAWLERNPILLNWQSCPGLQAGYDKLVTARVEMRGSYINVFFNNNYVGTYSATFSGSPHVGLVTGSWDRTPVQSHFDNFRVTDK
jgi:uncharacterized repeat protein (TIGR01451 family)